LTTRGFRTPDELDQAQPVAERVGKHGDLAVGGGVDVVLKGGAGFERAGDGGCDVGDRDVEMHRGPVAIVGSGLRAGADGVRGLAQQIDRRRPAGQFDRFGAEAAARGEAEGGGVEDEGGVEVGNVDIDEDGHRRSDCQLTQPS
jgi:hypothetical protein